jgi:hypothetical protein
MNVIRTPNVLHTSRLLTLLGLLSLVSTNQIIPEI